MNSLAQWFTFLNLGVHRLPGNVTKNEIEYQVNGAPGSVRQFPHLEKYRVEWLTDKSFKLVCKCCGR